MSLSCINTYGLANCHRSTRTSVTHFLLAVPLDFVGKMTVIWHLFVAVMGVAAVQGTSGLFHRCPPNNGNFVDFYEHCSCAKTPQNYIVSVTCEGINTGEILRESLLNLSKYTIDILTVKRSGPLSLGSDSFRKLNINKLIFEEVTFYDVQVFRAFRSLEFTLEELHFVKCNATLWSWGEGRQFVHLETVRFEVTNLPDTLTNDLVFKFFPNKIRKLQINGCSVRTLGDQALAKFSHLEHVELNRNRISTIKRSMFSPTLRKLKLISLIGNPLQSLDNETFVNMTRLEFLLLSDTRLTSLDEGTFLPVWDQLEEIYFNNIHLNCDCSSIWMLHVSEFKTFRAPYCDAHGKPINELIARDLCRTRRPN